MKKEIYWIILFIASLPFVIISCSSDDDNTLTFNDVKLYHGGKFFIPGGEDAKWESDNIWVATVSDNCVNAHCIGSTTISSKYGKFNVTVEPRYTNVIMPSKNYGASISTIKSEMSRYNLQYSTDEGLVYEAPSPYLYFICFFNNGRMYSSAIACTASNFNTVANYMKERYFFVELNSTLASKENIIGLTSDKKEGCIVSYNVSGGYFLFLFLPATDISRGVENTDLCEKHKAIISTMMQ